MNKTNKWNRNPMILNQNDPNSNQRRQIVQNNNNNNESPEDQTPNSPTIIDETPLSQMPSAPYQPTSTIQTPTTDEETPDSHIPHPTMNLTINYFPSLLHRKQDKQPTNHTPEEGEFSDNSMVQSPAVIPKHPIQTTFKRPHEIHQTARNRLLLQTPLPEIRET